MMKIFSSRADGKSLTVTGTVGQESLKAAFSDGILAELMNSGFNSPWVLIDSTMLYSSTVPAKINSLTG
jgi:hypothetical protein